jgi:hypothetical protein
VDLKQQGHPPVTVRDGTARLGSRPRTGLTPCDGKDQEMAIEADPAIVTPPSQAGPRRSQTRAPAHR